jgi:predicted ATP-grasp superfamily ATP-dependent carboligase
MAVETRARTIVGVREASPAELACWDELLPQWPNHRVVHSRAWVESLRASGCGRPLYLVVEKDGETVGCLPGLLTSVGGWRLFGSPLAGWQTVSMGPAFDPERISTVEMIAPLVALLEREHRVDLIELLHPQLDRRAMEALGFRGRPVATFRAPLVPGDATRTFQLLHDSARRNVRRAERLGLIARFEDDERFVDEHYDQLREVYLRGGHVIPFGRDRVLACFRHMREAGRLLAPAVYLPDGTTCIATGMFFVDDRELLLWGWAHRVHYRWYRPTELMTWMAMERAVASGCEAFDLMGLGDFKAKFGATVDESKVRWVRSRRPWLARARDVAEVGYRLQQAVRGRALRLARRTDPDGAPGAPAHGAAACVLGDVDVVRALGLAGITCDVAAPPGDAARYSRFVRQQLAWSDPWEHPEELIEALVRYGLAQPEPPVLVYADDGALLMVSRHRERLRQAFRFVVPDAELVEQLVDKTRFQALAQRLRLPVPPAVCAAPWEQPPDALVAFGLPLVLKPLTRRPELWAPIAGAAKALRVDTPQALYDVWPRLAAARLAVVAQRPVPGPETAVESYHAYLDAKGRVVGEFTGRKIRTAPAELGDSTALEIGDQADVVALGRQVLRRLRLTGVAKLDFKRAPDGSLHLLEVNPRFTLWAHPGAVAGVNLPALVYGDLVGAPRSAPTRARAGVRWCRPWADAAAAREAGISLARWLPWVARCETKRAVAWDDPLPLLGAALFRVLHGDAAPSRNGKQHP